MPNEVIKDRRLGTKAQASLILYLIPLMEEK